MSTEQEIFKRMQARPAPKRFKKPPADAYHVIHLIRPADSVFWYFWDYDQESWDTYYGDLSTTMIRQLMGFKGDKELSVLLHPVSK